MRSGTVGTLLGQLDRLVSLLDVPTARFGIVPFPLMPVVPLSGFRIEDDAVVSIETLTGEQRLADPDEVAVYLQAFGTLREAAVFDRDASALIRRVARELGADGLSTSPTDRRRPDRPD